MIRRHSSFYPSSPHPRLAGSLHPPQSTSASPSHAGHRSADCPMLELESHIHSFLFGLFWNQVLILGWLSRHSYLTFSNFPICETDSMEHTLTCATLLHTEWPGIQTAPTRPCNHKWAVCCEHAISAQWASALFSAPTNVSWHLDVVDYCSIGMGCLPLRKIIDKPTVSKNTVIVAWCLALVKLLI